MQTASRFRSLVAPIVFAALLTSLPLGGRAEETVAAIKPILQQRCTECHGADLKSGGLDLERLLETFDPRGDLKRWVKIEAAILKGKMPPDDEEPLSKRQIEVFGAWFARQFVMPGGRQRAGPSHPRRLSREELQNTLEDILHVDIRETVTNSRLHVIPDSIIEKFFPAGVLGDSGFSNDAATLSRESIDIQSYARCFSRVLSLVDTDREAREALFGTPSLPEDLSVSAARQIIARFGRAAFRRQMTVPETDTFVAVYQTMRSKRSAQQALRSSFLAILLSPAFLYRFEEPPQGCAPVVGGELAVRLSYFLWSAPPDQTLSDLAARGTLRDPTILREQVQRMLAHPRRIALAENLGGEWFGYKQLRQQSAVNKRSDKMAGFYRTQYEEALLFFDSIIRYDQPIFGVVDADWGFINPHQSGIYRLKTEAKTFDSNEPLPAINVHYRDTIRAVKRGNYEYKHAPLGLVKWSDSNRGGLLTSGSTMSVTSTPNRTSPIRRGVWVMEKILGVRFEPPQDVPDLESTQKKAESQRLNLSHNELLQLHSAQAGCAACHRYIDPIGFGLEVFDQLGIGRTVEVQIADAETLRWTPEETPKSFADRSWTLTKPIVAGDEYRVHFQWTVGRHRLDIKNVRLESGEVKIVDAHFGFTGNKNESNVWVLAIPETAPTSGWKLFAEVQGNRGTDSNGTITVSAAGAAAGGYQLPNGKSFASPSELKKLLLDDYREPITENVVRRVLAYALGRSIAPFDRPAVKQIKESLRANGYRLPALIEAVVLSYPFRHKEDR